MVGTTKIGFEQTKGSQMTLMKENKRKTTQGPLGRYKKHKDE